MLPSKLCEISITIDNPLLTKKIEAAAHFFSWFLCGNSDAMLP